MKQIEIVKSRNIPARTVVCISHIKIFMNVRDYTPEFGGGVWFYKYGRPHGQCKTISK